LKEVEIAERLAVSRTPVREAISRLIGDRLVHELAAGGVEVVDIRAEMEEIYLIREALEVCAVGLAASRIDDKQLEVLESLVETAEATSYRQHRRRAALNEAFHLAIARAAHSPRLAALIADFREYFLNPSWLSQQTEESAREALKDHRAIIEALSRRDRDTAEAALRGHLGRSFKGMSPDQQATSAAEPGGKRQERKRKAASTA
jgi:DNA-binding GntR family transcriptional regulator